MSIFSYKTRGNSAPQGKPRVFFACHPEDQRAFFNDLAADVLKNSDCTVYFLTSEPQGKAQCDEVLEGLAQMRLFLFPVTARLLWGDSFAVRHALEYAARVHIPILPVVCESFSAESGFAARYAELFGNVQYLDKKTNDATAISYEEKIKKFLTAVLEDDATAKRIRESFDGYIFLSYRKKDRKHAAELMRRIHSTPACRDMAIWYDEFLVPGEDFNNAISDALAKSRLFAMVVTPNLVNEENYVSAIEYPMAKKAGKKILPAEMVPTGDKLLEEKYQGIPRKVDAMDDKALFAAVGESLGELSLMQNADDAEHNYLIGLAYLLGIDVEVDVERALALIREAAEQGFTQAAVKMATVYGNGEGVARDPHKEIEWLERAIALAKRDYDKSGKIDDFVCWMTLQLGAGLALCALGKTGKAKKLYGDVIKRAKRLQASRDSETSVLAGGTLADGYDAMGRLLERIGKNKKASDYYRMSMQIRRQNAALMGNRGTVAMEIALSLANLAKNAMEQGDLNAANEQYQQAAAAFEQLAKESGDAQARGNLCVVYNKLTELYRSAGDFNGAKHFGTKAIEVGKALVSDFGDADAVCSLAISYDLFGNVLQFENNMAQAKRYFVLAVELYERLVRERNSTQDQRNLATGYNNLAIAQSADGEYREAEANYRKMLTCSERLYAETKDPESRRKVGIAYNNLGDLYGELKMYDEAIEKFRQCVSLREAICRETDAIYAQQDLALACNNLGVAFQNAGRLNEAVSFFQKAARAYEALSKRTGSYDDLEELAGAYMMLGSILEEQGEPGYALDYNKKALAAAERLAAKSSTVNAWSVAIVAAQNAFFVSGDRQYLLKALHAAKQLIRLDPYNPLYREQLQNIEGALQR